MTPVAPMVARPVRLRPGARTPTNLLEGTLK
nr:MAG TPA: hypothetical protein [Caudoviricetes sp.]